MALEVISINMMALENSKKHKTHKYENVHLNPATPIFRRGQDFDFEITLNRAYNKEADMIRVLFKYEDDKNSRGPRGGAWINDCPASFDVNEMWSLKLVSNVDKTLKLRMQTPIRIPIGCWKMVIKCDLLSHLASSTYEHPEIIYILLNPWHKDDDVYMPDTHLLEEYVMNDVGKVYIGAKSSTVGRHWLFGQFEAHVLPILRKLLKLVNLDYHEKGNPIFLSRVAFKVGKLLLGNWSGNYKDGTNPSMWIGSAPILKEYSETGEPVKYGQCWVFASLGCTLCRAMGIPSRVVTNIVNAMDYDDSLTVDNYYNEKGEFLNEDSESVWNFHAFIDVWMARPDLAKGYGGWQHIDPTNGYGPASLEAVKQGEVGLQYNVAAVITEINSDLINWKKDETALTGYKKIKVNTSYIGYKMLTKKPFIFDPNGERDQDDVMHMYKNQEGTKEERLALFKAAFKCSDKSCEVFGMEGGKELEEIKFCIPTFTLGKFNIGKNITIVLDLENVINETRHIQVAISVLSVYYNGVKGHTIKKISDIVKIGPNSIEQFKLQITPEDYIGKLVEFNTVKAFMMATVEETKQTWSGEEDFHISKPKLNIETDGLTKVGKTGKIFFRIKNPLAIELTDCELSYDSPGLLKYEKLPFRNILPEENVKMETSVKPTSGGKFNIIALFYSKQLHDIMGSAIIQVSS